jgi:aspartate racemase
MKYVEADNWKGVASLMSASVKKLGKVGADFAICPDNTIHEAFNIVIEKSSIPWLHIAEEVAKETKRQSHKCLGVLGTRYLMEGPVYSDTLTKMGINFKIPEKEDRERINEIRFNELVYGKFHQNSGDYFEQVIDKLKNEGCDAVVLGCTEIPLIVLPETSPLPTLDSTRLLARAALTYAVESPLPTGR